MRQWLVVIVSGLLVLAGMGYRAHNRVLPKLTQNGEARPLGVFHVHSDMSHDGHVKVEELAAIASQQKLDFLVLTDHNRQLAGPVTVGDVTLLSFAEISTGFGHVVGLAARDLPPETVRNNLEVVRDIRALGGNPIATHPADTKRPWDGPMVGLAGFEIANVASAARRRGGPIFLGLVPTLLAYGVHRDLALAQLYDRDARALTRWDRESSAAFVGYCGADAHGRPLPMADNLRAFALSLHAALPSDTDERPAAILSALLRGRFHCVTPLFGRNPRFEFEAYLGSHWAGAAGDSLTLDEVDALKIKGPTTESGERPQLVLFRNGQEVVRTHESELNYKAPPPGTYRVEVRLEIPGILFGNRSVPVIYSNRIRITPPKAATSDAEPELSP